MTINFTLFLQIINFFIAYLIITKILLKPAIHVIREDKSIEDEILNDIKDKELEITNKEFLKKTLWNRSLEYFQKEKPIINPLEVSILWRTPQMKNLSDLFTLDLKKKLTDFVVETVKHVE